LLPYIYLFLALFMGGIMGVLTKVSEVNKCNPTVTTTALFFWGAGLLAVQTIWVESASLAVPGFVSVTGIIFGLLAGIAFVAFLSGIKYGKIATSWLVTSLSPIVPAVVSFVVYKEPMVATKAISLLLILVALMFLFIDKREEEKLSTESKDAKQKVLFKWAWRMTVVFLCASMATFGLKILAESGMSDSYRSQFLFYWYVGGFVLAGVILIANKLPVRRRELLIGLLIALSSVFSMTFLSLALENQVPGYVAFMATGIGSIFVVAAAGLIFFHEKLTGYGYLGIAIGCLAVALLGL
jgi:drug/metabolite transporter (DMT)-like permease